MIDRDVLKVIASTDATVHTQARPERADRDGNGVQETNATTLHQVDLTEQASIPANGTRIRTE